MIQAAVLAIGLLLHVPFAATPEQPTSVQVYPAAAFYSGDALRSMTLGGMSVVYQLNRIVWVGIDGMAGPAHVDRNNGLGIRSDDLFVSLDGALYWNLPALLGVSLTADHSGTGADLYTSIGAGHLWIGDHGEVFGFIGGGMNIYLPIRWLVVRFDLKNLFFLLPNSNGSDFNSDLVLSLGPSLAF